LDFEILYFPNNLLAENVSILFSS